MARTPEAPSALQAGINIAAQAIEASRGKDISKTLQEINKTAQEAQNQENKK